MIFTNITCAFNELNKIDNNIFIESHNKKKKFFYASKSNENDLEKAKAINLKFDNQVIVEKK